MVFSTSFHFLWRDFCLPPLNLACRIASLVISFLLAISIRNLFFPLTLSHTPFLTSVHVSKTNIYIWMMFNICITLFGETSQEEEEEEKMIKMITSYFDICYAIKAESNRIHIANWVQYVMMFWIWFVAYSFIHNFVEYYLDFAICNFRDIYILLFPHQANEHTKQHTRTAKSMRTMHPHNLPYVIRFVWKIFIYCTYCLCVPLILSLDTFLFAFFASA